MSHHLDSPLARQATRLDITDLYLFRGTAGTVFVMNSNSSVADPRYPERFHPEALYEFKVDTECVRNKYQVKGRNNEYKQERHCSGLHRSAE
jgi:hypothetical protein